MQNLHFVAQRVDWDNEVQIALFDEGFGECRSVAKPADIIFEPLKKGEIIDPVFRFKSLDAQKLFDALYKVGFRPTKPASDEGLMSALSYHLEDMRKLVFSELRK